MARVVKQAETKDKKDESLVRVFFSGFFWPVRMIGRGLSWLGHRPPLKQVGHGFRWFFRLKPVSFLGKILGVSFVAGSASEMKHVTWPSRSDGLRLTWAVILFSVIFAALLAGVDYGLDKAFKQLLLK